MGRPGLIPGHLLKALADLLPFRFLQRRQPLDVRLLPPLEPFGKIFRQNQPERGQEQRLLEDVLQFPHITRPVIGEEKLHDLIGYPHRRRSQLFQQGLHELGQILLVLPEGRDVETDDETVEEIGAEGAFFYLLVDVSVGRRQDPE